MGRPVSAATSADFPWSMCPAVPMIMPPPRAAKPELEAGELGALGQVVAHVAREKSSVRGAMTLVKRRQRRVRIE